MSDQARHWSKAARDYDEQFVDPFHPDAENPLLQWLLKRKPNRQATAADVGCGTGPLLPYLSERFGQVHAIDFAKGMLERAQERCEKRTNITYHRRSMTDLSPLHGQVQLVAACNSIVLPEINELTKALDEIYAILEPGGRFVGILPAIDGVHYLTMLVLDRALARGLPQDKARLNTANHVEHEFYDFAFNGFHFKGLNQHFWYPFEIRYRLKRAGFRRIKLAKVWLPWSQFDAVSRDLLDEPSPWDWFFYARKPKK